MNELTILGQQIMKEHAAFLAGIQEIQVTNLLSMSNAAIGCPGPINGPPGMDKTLPIDTQTQIPPPQAQLPMSQQQQQHHAPHPQVQQAHAHPPPPPPHTPIPHPSTAQLSDKMIGCATGSPVCSRSWSVQR
jgi:hypothetical protein